MTRTIIFHSIQIFDSRRGVMSSEPVDVSVVSGQIFSLAASGKGTVPQGADRIDGEGKFLLPGLMDLHCHVSSIFYDKPEPSVLLWMKRQIRKNLEVSLRTGFTTLRDMMSPIKLLNTFREKIRRGKILGPRVLTPGPFLCCAGGYPHFLPPSSALQKFLVGPMRMEIPSHSAIEPALKWLRKHHIDFVKVAVTDKEFDVAETPLKMFDEDRFRNICTTAHSMGFKVAAHCTWIKCFRDALELPLDTIEHLPMDGVFSDQDIATIKQTGINLVPTFKIAMDMVRENPWEHRNFSPLFTTPTVHQIFEDAPINYIKRLTEDRWNDPLAKLQEKAILERSEEHTSELQSH